MSDKEKIDMLLEKLVDFYEIDAELETENELLSHKISVTETRLKAMGVTDFSGLKPKKKNK